jgi:hypothetical protein
MKGRRVKKVKGKKEREREEIFISSCLLSIVPDDVMKL